VPWRCFPWDPGAAAGAPFSATYLVPGQTVGRFDLHDRPPVWYLAESPAHALGEVLAPFRGTTFHPSYLRVRGHALALVEVTLAPSLLARIPDCTDSRVLTRLGLRPDDLSHHDRTVTQEIARSLHPRGAVTGDPAGLHWWSALTGAWHSTVIFADRARRGELAFGTPRHVTRDDPELGEALRLLGVRTR
jgi:hypothetical protein